MLDYTGITILNMIQYLLNETGCSWREMERNQFFLDFSQKIAIGANEERMTKVKDGKNEVRRETYSLRKDYPLTQTQAGILTESLLQPDTTIYNIPMLYRISEKVDLQRLKSALEAAISKHPCLSATLFANDAGEYRTLRNDGEAPKVELIEVLTSYFHQENHQSIPLTFL